MIPANNEDRLVLEPILPLINIVFLLLIFFMLAGKMRDPSIREITAPIQSVQMEELMTDPENWFYLNESGQLFHKDREISNEQLVEKLSHLEISENPVLLADRSSRADIFSPVLRIFSQSKARKLLLVTEFSESADE